MQILVTGGSGFVGQATVAALRDAGHNVLIVGRKAGAEPLGYTANLLNRGERKLMVRKAKADALVHLAWHTCPGNFWDAPDNTDWARASHELIKYFFDAGGKRAVLAGSCAEYDWSATERPLAETARCHPRSIYGSCKLELLHQCEQMVSAGASIAWGRLFFLLGPREHPARFIPSIVRSLLDGQAANMSHGSQIRDFLHVTDAGRAFAALVDTPLNGVVNVASGVGVSLATLAKTAHKQIGRGELILGALPMRPADPQKLVADVRRLKDEVGFAWSHDWRSALDTCVEYWRQRAHKQHRT